MQAEVVQLKQQQLQCIISLSPSVAPFLTEAAYKYGNYVGFIRISGKGPWKILIHNPSPFSVGTEKVTACNVTLSAKACSKETFCICVKNPLVASMTDSHDALAFVTLTDST